MPSHIKFSKGPRSRIPLEQTPFDEGRIYFVPEDGDVYIDAKVSDEDKRVRVGQKETVAAQRPEDMADGDTWLEEVE